MDAVVFIGLQASGKSSFYKDRFEDSHIRINLDMLKTRYRESQLLEFCLGTGQPFVVDNTNPTKIDRAKYLLPCKEAGFHTIGYYFESKIEDCLKRNCHRTEQAHVPTAGILATYKRLELPSWSEGFDELWYVKIEKNEFEVSRWIDEI